MLQLPSTTFKISLGKGDILDCPALRIEVLALEVVPGMELYRRIGIGRIFREGWSKSARLRILSSFDENLIGVCN
jgi:hypothetical protein